MVLLNGHYLHDMLLLVIPFLYLFLCLIFPFSVIFVFVTHPRPPDVTQSKSGDLMVASSSAGKGREKIYLFTFFFQAFNNFKKLEISFLLFFFKSLRKVQQIKGHDSYEKH